MKGTRGDQINPGDLLEMPKPSLCIYSPMALPHRFPFDTMKELPFLAPRAESHWRSTSDTRAVICQ